MLKPGILIFAFSICSASIWCQTHPDTLFNQAMYYFEQELFIESVGLFDELVQQQSDYPNARLYLGISKELTGDPFAAMLDYTEVLKMDKEDSWARHYRASLYYRLSQYERAIQDYDTILIYNPVDDVAFSSRALCYLDIGELDLAEKDLNVAITLEPQMPEYYFYMGWVNAIRGDFLKAIPLYTEAIDLNPEFADAYLYRGEAYEITGQTIKAIEDYEKSLEIGSIEDYYTHFLLGNIRMDEGDFNTALELFNESIDEQPNFSESRCSRGWLRYLMDDLQGAFEDLKLAIELDPEFGLAYNNLGVVARDLKKKESAINYFIQAIEYSKSEQHFPHFNLAEIYTELGQLDESILHYSKALEHQPAYPEALNGRGWAYYLQQNQEKAILDFDKAIALKPNFALVYNNKGVVYQSMERYEEAISYFSKAIGFQTPNLYYPFYNRGNIYLVQKKYEAAIEDYSNTLIITPHADALNNRGWAKQQLGNLEGAIKDYEAALKVNPEHPMAIQNLKQAKDDQKTKKGQ